MTIYNADRFLREAVDSIVAQTFGDWELIAVENGSSDRSLEILSGYKDERIRVIALPNNIGRTAALNLACRAANGEYIAILDADDLAEKNRFEAQVEFMDQNQAIGLVGAWAKLIDESGELISYYTPPASPAHVNEALSWSMPIVHSTMLVRRSILVDELDCYSPELLIGQDWDLCVRVAEKYPVCVLGQVLGAWRRYPSSITGSSPNFFRVRLETLKILERAGGLAISRPSIVQNRRRRAVTLLAISYYSILNKRISEALKFLWRALRTDTLCIFGNQKVRSLFFKDIPDHRRAIR